MWFSFEEKGYGFLEVEAVFIEAYSSEEAAIIFEGRFGHDPLAHCTNGEKFWIEMALTLEDASRPVREQIDGTYECMSSFIKRSDILIFSKQAV